MAPTATTSTPDCGKLREALLRRAAKDATDAVEKATTLRGADARKVAQAALGAAGDSLRSEYALRFASRRDPVALAGAAVGLGLDLVLFGSIAAGKNARALRPLAAVAAVVRAGLFGYAQHRSKALRAQIGAAAGGRTEGRA